MGERGQGLRAAPGSEDSTRGGGTGTRGGGGLLGEAASGTISGENRLPANVLLVFRRLPGQGWSGDGVGWAESSRPPHSPKAWGTAVGLEDSAHPTAPATPLDLPFP